MERKGYAIRSLSGEVLINTVKSRADMAKEAFCHITGESWEALRKQGYHSVKVCVSPTN